MAGPSMAQGHTTNACSLVDLLPTTVQIGGGSPEMFGTPVDGRSLMALARGEDDDVSEAIGEYCAEMTGQPVFMIRRGDMKCIYWDSNPAQLYDVPNDPWERETLAENPACVLLAENFVKEVAERWDCVALRQKVMDTQKTASL